MRVSIRGLIACAWIAWAGGALAAPGDAPAPAPAPAVNPQAQHQAAEAEYRRGNAHKALELIDQSLAAAPNDLKLLLLKGTILLEQRDYPGALVAYEAYLAAGVTGQNQRTAQTIVQKLLAVKTTFLDITLANGPAEIYLESKTLGPFCRAAPSCHRAWLPGTYEVIAERAGFERWTGSVTVQQGTTAKLAITLVEKPSLLTLKIEPAGARVTVDGKPYDRPIEVAAGAHRIEVSLQGHREKRLVLDAREGKPVERELVLEPIARPPGPPPRFTLQRKLAIAAGGVSVVAAGIGLGLGLDALGLEDEAFALCPSRECGSFAEANELNRRARSRGAQANVAYGIAGAAAAAAAILWLTGAPESRVAVTPQLGAAAGVDVVVRF